MGTGLLFSLVSQEMMFYEHYMCICVSVLVTLELISQFR